MSSFGTETIVTIRYRIPNPCQSACPLVGTQKTVICTNGNLLLHQD